MHVSNLPNVIKDKLGYYKPYQRGLYIYKQRGKLKKCFACGKKAFVTQSQLNRGKGLYCSHSCASKGNKSRWTGGVIRRNNRVWVWTGGTYTQRSRLVVQEFLGRKLTRLDLVHHINHNPDDDRIENLYLTHRGEHARIHFKGERMTCVKTQTST